MVGILKERFGKLVKEENETLSIKMKQAQSQENLEMQAANLKKLQL